VTSRKCVAKNTEENRIVFPHPKEGEAKFVHVLPIHIDLTAEQIAKAYKLRWEIETFFAWWKQHLSVYHILATDLLEYTSCAISTNFAVE